MRIFTKGRLKGWARGIVSVLILLLATMTFLPSLGTNTWFVRFMSFPRLQFLCILAGLLVLSLALPGRFRWTGLLPSILAAAALGYQCWVFFPYTPLATVQVMDAQGCANAFRLTLLESNVQMINEHAERLFDEIRSNQPDVILVEEVDPWWHERLETLHETYPYRQHHVTQNYYGIDLLSRYPLRDPKIVFLANSRDPAVFAGVQLPSGQVIRIYGIHPRPPTFGQSSAERDAQILETSLRIAEDGGPAILAGDLNATPWSKILRRAARIAHLLDPRIGRGWFPTWKAHSLILRWPLDNVLFTNEFTLVDFRVLPPIGSDHQPTLTKVCYTPAAAARQPAPRPNPGDIAAAYAAIAAGRGKAAPSPEPAPGAQQPPNQGGGLK